MTAWARVCVAGPDSSIDVGLPADLPITDYLDELVLRLAGPPDLTAPALEWTLSPIGCDAIEPTETLRSAGVDSGTVLVLREGPAADPAVLIDDTLDALTELIDSRHRSWSPYAARVAGSVGAVCATAVGAAGLMVARGTAAPVTQAATAAVAAIGAVSVLAAALWTGRAHQRGGPVPVALCGMSALMWAAAGFTVVPGRPGAAHALLAAIAAMVSAAITLRLTRRTPITHLAVITAGALVALTAAFAIGGLDRSRTAALIGVVALLLSFAAPRLTVVLAKIPLPPVPSPGEPIDAVEVPLLPTIDAVDAVSLSALPDIDALTRRAEHARQCLTGLCAGAAAAGAVAIATAGIDPPDWRFTAVALAVGFAFVLRGRSHTDLTAATALITGGTMGVLGFLAAGITTAAISDDPTLPFPAALAALAAAAAALLIGGWAAGRTFSPLQRRAAELAEYAQLVVLLPLLLWVLEVYRMIREAW
jgi:type VII secretion integral membrane protein EccD